ncbi:hypothetical protein [Rhodovulum sulfidophilum]|uniref:hypothetical protein n=1 Tax=Rhodovulum sulfidophilum TaxID=35806 RepID=UPI000952FDF3|nr:hypothetical protein [Rhodovulum sulfidophilum]OLS48917.1 hypothetical protein BV379_11945 [Rhodovulum sulfidophilum]
MIGRAMQGAMRGAWQGLRQALREGESGWEVVSTAGAHPFAGLGRQSKAARIRAEQEARAWLAWHVEALRRCPSLPSFRSFLGGRSGPEAAQPATEMQAMFDTVATAWARSPAARG